MSNHKTGHGEIDQQHEILENLVGELSVFCTETAGNAEASCNNCSPEKRNKCSTSLVAITTKLTAFLIGHSTYEERMMELLPDSPSCQTHIKAHKAAHEGIANKLQNLKTQIAQQSPLASSKLIWQVSIDWLGDHIEIFDRRMLTLSKSSTPEINLDGELVEMLDQHVFHNRPTSTKVSADLKRNRLEIRSHFDSLSKAQVAVFWLVVSGKTSREIANELCVTVNTIKTHRNAIFEKMGVSSVLELVRKSDFLR